MPKDPTVKTTNFLQFSILLWTYLGISSKRDIKVCNWVYLGYQSYVKPLWTTFKIQLAFSNRSVFSADLSWLEWKELFSSGRSMPWGLGHTPCPSVDMVELTANIRWAFSPESTSERIAVGIELSTLSFKRVWVGEATAKYDVMNCDIEEVHGQDAFGITCS